MPSNKTIDNTILVMRHTCKTLLILILLLTTGKLSNPFWPPVSILIRNESVYSSTLVVLITNGWGSYVKANSTFKCEHDWSNKEPHQGKTEEEYKDLVPPTLETCKS